MEGLFGGVIDQGEDSGYCCGVEEYFLTKLSGELREETKGGWLLG